MKRVCVCCFLFLALTASAGEPQAKSIKKIYFLIHPLTWVNHEEKYKAYFDYERRIEPRWHEAISKIGPDEALVLWPMIKSKRADDLVQHAKATLGPRCVIIPRSKDWYGCCEEYGKRGTPAKLDPEILAGIGHDLVNAMLVRGETWPVDEMSQAMSARTFAKDIQAAFRENGLAFDPSEVASEAWGESFDGCAGKWSGFLGSYLGFRKPVQLRFELTVPDAKFLLDAEYLESVPLQHNVRVYLWRAADGRLVGFYEAGLQRVADPPLYAVFDPAGIDLSELEVYERWPGARIWPGEDSVLAQKKDALLKVAISRNLARRPGWKYSPGEAVYIFAKGIRLEDFRKALIEAHIVDKL